MRESTGFIDQGTNVTSIPVPLLSGTGNTERYKWYFKLLLFLKPAVGISSRSNLRALLGVSKIREKRIISNIQCQFLLFLFHRLLF